MSSTENKPAFAGLSLADQLKDFDAPAQGAGPAKPDPKKLRVLSTEAGFPSREPQPLPVKPPPRPLQFETRVTIRTSAEDKERFEELSYRLRKANGETFKLALDALEASLKAPSA
jgi:hypothetical protein